MLVGLWQDKTRPSREVKRVALQQLAELEAKIIELTAMRDALAGLARPAIGRQPAGLPDPSGPGRFVHPSQTSSNG